ncbi:phosphoheptose isomerase [Anaerosporomusa subterranea]|uniref:Phosphoheptose isomerase n=1 Tax=Anaerosporomusa subterranea TaxID=1794912 RepID=A0A154BW63_ANASB|nr:D-sedoheptulose 7-phosphate isomerase [Anaerosporomusa subterranea]KYZ78191.1 phosphoheptose isomerase [Anaerosporomusa subterranea]
MDIYQLVQSHLSVIEQLQAHNLKGIQEFAQVCQKALQSGNTLFFMGNGGSAADSQHLASEFVGRFVKERRGLPAVALNTDTSILTAIGNDYGFENIFSRQVEALVNSGDVVVGLSTSGKSPNVVKAIETAKAKGAVTVGLTGDNGGRLQGLCDICIVVPTGITARIQEAHILIGHIVCEYIDQEDLPECLKTVIP